MVQDPNPFEDAKDILKRYEDGGYDEIVVVAPLSVIAKLTEAGVRPLWAEMETIDEKDFNEYDSVKVGGRVYRFKEYKTTQYRINLRKEQVEKSGLDCDDEIGILAWDETQQLIKAYQEYERLTGHYTKLQTEHTKLINEHKHLKEIYKKREVSDSLP